MIRVASGTATLLVPIVLLAFSQPLISLMSSDGPVPQGGMVCFGMLWILSLFICIPHGILWINSADRPLARRDRE